MFRNSKYSEINPKNFGAGSIVEGAPGEDYLVLASDDPGYVALFSMTTFKICTHWMIVDDANWLSESEARHLIDGLGVNATFSDFTCLAKGLKK